MDERPMSLKERQQLGILYSVYQNPTITAWWDKGACARLIELGYAEEHEYAGGIKVAHITPAGIEAARIMRTTTVGRVHPSDLVSTEDDGA